MPRISAITAATIVLLESSQRIVFECRNILWLGLVGGRGAEERGTARVYMSDVPVKVHYTALDNSNPQSTAAASTTFFESLKTKKGIAIMVAVGIGTLLTTLLLVFLLPRRGVEAQSGGNGGSNDPSAGSKFSSPPYYPARNFGFDLR